MIFVMLGRGSSKSTKDFETLMEVSMQTYQMRDWVKSAYSGPNWKAKVDKMEDNQIIALYRSLIKQGKIKGA